MSSAIENAATNDAHANWSPTPIAATPGFLLQETRSRTIGSVGKSGNRRQETGPGGLSYFGPTRMAGGSAAGSFPAPCSAACIATM